MAANLLTTLSRYAEVEEIAVKVLTNASISSLLLLLASTAIATPIDPPEDWVRRVAARETETEAARSHYTYRQVVTVEDFSSKGIKAGMYREVRDIVFSPSGERSENVVGKPIMQLERIKMTDEDFRDLREVQPMLITKETLFLYERKYRGEDTVDGIACWMLEIKPRQILSGQRFFDGTLWIDQRDFSVIRTEGRAVPQIVTTKEENLFTRFTTVRLKVDGDHWFPSKTFGDDVLPFRNGPVRLRTSIDYSNYQRFGTESKVTFGEAK